MIEERLVNIETKITFQEDLIEELNKTVYQQQQSWIGLKPFVQHFQDTSNRWLKREMKASLRMKDRRITRLAEHWLQTE